MKIKFLPVLLGVAVLPVVAQVTPSSKIVSLSENKDLSLPMAKRAKSQILQLDSVVKFSYSANMPLSKDVYTYESDKEILVRLVWDSSTKEWGESSKIISIYGENGNIRSIESLSWDFSAKEWSNASKINYQWHSADKLALMESQRWDVSSLSWITRQSELYSYTANGDQSGMVISMWDSGTETLVEMMQQLWNYDQNNQLVSSQGYMRNGEEMAPSNKFEYTYDENKQIEISYAFKNELWQAKEKTETLRDANGNDTLILKYEWDNQTQAWVQQAEERTVQQFDARNNMLLYEYYRWQGGVWVGSKKHVSEFDANDREIAYEEYEWEDLKGEWEKDSKIARTYDVNGYLTLVEGLWWSVNDWNFNEKSTYYYSVPTSIDETSAKSIRVYVADGRIEAGESDVPMDVYNANGVKVANRNLAKGLYLVRLGDRSTKVIVK